jgi:hypothetical protein
MIDMMDSSFDRRSTGLTRAKHFERLALWLGLPLLLALLCLTAGVVNYTPVRQYEATTRVRTVPQATPAPANQAPREHPMPMRGEGTRTDVLPKDVGQAGRTTGSLDLLS